MKHRVQLRQIVGAVGHIRCAGANEVGYAAMCQKLVEGGYHPAKAKVTATMKLLRLSYSLAKNDEILSALMAYSVAVDAAHPACVRELLREGTTLKCDKTSVQVGI